MLPALLNNFEKKSEIEQKALELLKKVGLEERKNHKPSQLSGGEKQRVSNSKSVNKFSKNLISR